MGNVAIVALGLGKQYRIGAKKQSYYTLRDTLMNVLASPVRRLSQLRGKGGTEEEMFWALRDVSFEVKHGEIVGVIGRNGSGKSTLLKILSRITAPTEGYAEIHGQVARLSAMRCAKMAERNYDTKGKPIWPRLLRGA